MTPPTAQPATSAATPSPLAPPPQRRFLALREDIPQWEGLFHGALCIVLCVGVWGFVTWGEPEQRILSYTVLPSPGETLAEFSSLWFDRALTRNTLATLWRVVLGFGLAAIVGIPLGVLCGCFSRVQAFFAPLSIFGRNIPVAALIPLTFSLFGIGEFQKVMFLFIASVAFVFSDTARAISDIGNQYIDTAYTLGANRRQVIIKVLLPLAMPSVFNSLRLLFGLAFGYIMLGELVTIGDVGGLGHIINVSMRRGPREHILLVLLIIPLVALAIDRLLFWGQRELFPYRYKGNGILHHGMQTLFHAWEDIAGALWRRPVPPLPPRSQPSTTPPPSHHESKQS
ncbi:MAG: ABC transporter permease subunit [Deltaproteobacteria bacterium]|nr:ABC transporter permease subunit [Deltaproteobacteria bacterium]